MKNNNIKTSLIFTKFGYWNIDFEGKMEITEKEHIYINRTYSRAFHIENNRGIYYNQEAIDYYIDKLNKIPNLKISFTKY